MANAVSVPVRQRSLYKELTNEQRIAILGMLVGGSLGGGLRHGTFSQIAQKYCVAPRVVRRLWHSCPQTRQTGLVDLSEVMGRRHFRGRKIKWDRTELEDAVMKVPVLERQTFRDLAEKIDVPKTTLQRITEEEEILRRKKIYLKPKLGDHHRVWRMEYCLAQEDSSRVGYFKDQYNVVHVDEKWFHMTKDGRVVILGKDEPDPYHTIQHKSYIGKVMFLCATARPRQTAEGYFDGKIGVWPFGRFIPAARSSKNRPKGTPEWHNETCDAVNYRCMLINHVLPAVMLKFPWSYVTSSNRRVGVTIQQDGAGGQLFRINRY